MPGRPGRLEVLPVSSNLSDLALALRPFIVGMIGRGLTINGILTATGKIRTNSVFNQNGTDGYTGTISVRKGDDSGALSLEFKGGILTGVT